MENIQCPIYHCDYCGTPIRLEVHVKDAPDTIDCDCGKSSGRAGTSSGSSVDGKYSGERHTISLGM